MLNKRYCTAAALSLIYVLINIGFGGFDDEWDNLLSGQLLANGQMLYRDTFSLHLPLPYLLIGLLQTVGIHDVVCIRAIIFTGCWLLFQAALYRTYEPKREKAFILLNIALALLTPPCGYML